MTIEFEYSGQHGSHNGQGEKLHLPLKPQNRLVSGFSGKLFIHIGPHKTGTTTIQKYLHENAVMLRKSGVLYPKSGRGIEAPMQHWELGEAIITADVSRIEAVMQGIMNELAESQFHTIIISTEVLSRKSVVEKDLQLLVKLFPLASRTWLVVLRGQDQLLNSLYSEHIKKGHLAWPSSYKELAGPEFLDHVRRLRLVANVSESELVLVARFADIRLNLVDSFLTMIGHKELYVPHVGRNLHENLSVPGRALRLLRYVNALPKRAAEALRRRILAYAKINPTLLSGPAIAPASLEIVLAPYFAGNWAIERGLFRDAPGRLPIPAQHSEEVALKELDPALSSRMRGWVPCNKSVPAP